MDSTTNGKEEIKQIANQKHMHEWTIKIDPNQVEEYDNLMERIDIIHEINSDIIDKYVATGTKEILNSFNGSILYAGQAAISSIHAVEFLEKRLTNLEKIINEITQKLNIDLPNVKAEIVSLKTVVESPMFAKVLQVAEILEKLKKQAQDSEKAVGAYSV